jgi:hypothetical protein
MAVILYLALLLQLAEAQVLLDGIAAPALYVAALVVVVAVVVAGLLKQVRLVQQAKVTTVEQVLLLVKIIPVQVAAVRVLWANEVHMPHMEDKAALVFVLLLMAHEFFTPVAVAVVLTTLVVVE